MAGEQEEFEFRARMEREAASRQPAQQAQAPQAPQYGPAIDYNPVITMGEATAALGSGSIAGPVSGFAGMLGSVLPGPQGQGADWTRRVQEAMTYQPRTAGGQGYTNVVTAPFEALAHGADAAGGWVAEQTGSPAAGAFVNTGLQAAPMVLGKVIPKVTTKPSGNAATQAGFKATPQESGGGIIQNNMASVAGEPRLARKISKANEDKVHEKIAKDFGLEEGEVITRETLEGIREKNGAAYETLRKAGKVDVDKAFLDELGGIVKERQGAAKDFPRGADPVMEVYKRLTKNKDGSVKRGFDADSAVSEIKNLRKDAGKAFKSGDTELGKTNLKAAEALENILDRHMSKSGNAAGMQDFRKARQQIAKTYDAEKAMVADGKLNPQVYAKLLEKGRPLSGGSLEVAEAARAAPRSLQKPSTQGTGITFADVALAALEGSKTLGVKPLIMAARPGLRSVMASGPYQSAITRGGLSGALASEAAGQALPLGAFAGLAGVERGGGTR